MSGPTAIRLAALLALAYAIWVFVSGPMHIGAGGGEMTLRLSMSHGMSWLIGLLSLAIALSLWMLLAFGWWLGLASALVQGWRVGSALVGHHAVRMPGVTTLVVLVLLVVFLALLFMPKARASCNR
jgi:hypothetical protein